MPSIKHHSLKRMKLTGRVRCAATTRPGLVACRKKVPKIGLAARLVSQQQQQRQQQIPRASPATSVSQQHGQEILARQRLNRPLSPHLGVYTVRQTFLSPSAWTRITGIALGGTAYLYLGAYAVSPLLGCDLGSAVVVSAFASLPAAAQAAVKFCLGFPFSYHLVNGVRHLLFDLGVGFRKTDFQRAELATWALGILGGLSLAFCF